ncbi:MAG: S8 family serine peptidase [Candidatus Nanoarchaeia archaeon]|nr:S8 family serine peptidase [Candidatus Nanoarchaeia archaeon]
MKKRVIIAFILLLSLFTFQRLNGFFVYDSGKNISIPDTFVQDIQINNAKFYDENNNGLIDKIQLENKFDKLKINDYDKKRVIITFKNKQLVKELTKNEIEELLKNPEVLSISEDSKYNLTLQDTIPLIGATNLHLNNLTGINETVCILDSGIYSEHPVFTNKIINEYCYSDDDYSDNNKGYCFNNTEEYPDANDDLGHGTIVAGIVSDVAPETKLVIVKICNLYGGCLYSDLIKGINYCINNKDKYNISVITLSLGTGYVYNDPNSCNLDNIDITNSINNAYSNNIFVDASSGNSHSNDGISAPACLENITAVGATDKQDRIASYSTMEI